MLATFVAMTLDSLRGLISAALSPGSFAINRAKMVINVRGRLCRTDNWNRAVKLE